MFPPNEFAYGAMLIQDLILGESEQKRMKVKEKKNHKINAAKTKSINHLKMKQMACLRTCAFKLLIGVTEQQTCHVTRW